MALGSGKGISSSGINVICAIMALMMLHATILCPIVMQSGPAASEVLGPVPLACGCSVMEAAGCCSRQATPASDPQVELDAQQLFIRDSSGRTVAQQSQAVVRADVSGDVLHALGHG